MPSALRGSDPWDDIHRDTTAFYRHVMQTLNAAGLPFLVGGAFAFACFTGIQRNTKDLDLFIRREHWDGTREALSQAGYGTELSFPHWLAKAWRGDDFVDLIFNSGNGLSPVDDGWFEHASEAEVLGVPVMIAPVEETLWTKAFIMERERYDGADIAHLLRAQAHRIDWQRLLRRFGPHWRVLLGHLVLFGFVYPGDRSLIPPPVMDELLTRLRDESAQLPPRTQLCAGTLLSREQYLNDVEQQGLQDARVTPLSTMTPQDVADWTGAIASRQAPPEGGSR
jgi:hypothetical protein